jgi:hypothetical protein
MREKSDRRVTYILGIGSSYALYRKNNIGDYECLTCGLRDIDEIVARRLQ